MKACAMAQIRSQSIVKFLHDVGPKPMLDLGVILINFYVGGFKKLPFVLHDPSVNFDYISVFWLVAFFKTQL